MVTANDIIEILQLRGAEQEALFEQARSQRFRVFGNQVVARGVIEITNQCRVNCEFCPMRRGNTRANDGFRLTADDLMEAVRPLRENDINVVFFQGGELPQTTRVVGEAIPRIRDMYHGDVEILLNLGNKSRDEYKYLRDQGATSYILKLETSDPELNQRMRHETLRSRLACLQDLLDLGYWVGTGSIVGLPGQDVASVARDIGFASSLGVHMCSVSPFIPAPDTPLASYPPGDVELTLNAIAAMRITEPRWLIPSVSALAKSQAGGQHRGFAAGANVLTMNFTPDAERKRYLIYGRDRFVVRRAYADELVTGTGLALRGSLFTGAARSVATPGSPEPVT
jgi:biotin synthase